MKSRLLPAALLGTVWVLLPDPVYAMHISEGILPWPHALFWTIVGGFFVFWALRRMIRKTNRAPIQKPFIGMVGAVVFLVSAMPIPVPTVGTVSHPAGTGIAVLLIGPGATIVVTSISLALQALFMAHGGISTLGADVFAMGVLGGFGGYAAYHAVKYLGGSTRWAAFASGLVGDWATYVGTSAILGAALSDGGLVPALQLFLTVLVAFVPTQLPLGILEGVLAAGVVVFLVKRRPHRMRELIHVSLAVVLLLTVVLPTAPAVGAEDTGAWPGVDKVIVEKTAEERGRPPVGPLIPVEGDVLLFAFLLAGMGGGFVVGYYYHALFVDER